MKKSFKDLIKMKATKRIVSAAVAIAMVCEALPVAQIGEKILQTDFSSLFSVSAADTPRFPTGNVNISLARFAEYSADCQAFPEDHQSDNITISSTGTTTFVKDFKGLGTQRYPFKGTITIGDLSNFVLELDAPLFNYVYDTVSVGSATGYLPVSRYYALGQSAVLDKNTALIAANVIQDPDADPETKPNASWYVNVAKPITGNDHYLGDFAGIIGTMDNSSKLAEVKVTIEGLASGAQPISISGKPLNGSSCNIGFACGTMKANSEITSFEITSDSAVGVIKETTTPRGHAGGLVGEMESGSKFTYTGANKLMSGDSTYMPIITSDGYAGGIVGKNNGGLITISGSSPYVIQHSISGTSGVGGVCGYFSPSGDLVSGNSFDVSKYSIDCTLNGNTSVGGLFGQMVSGNNVTINGSGTVVSNAAGGSGTNYGGLIGKYSTTDLAKTLLVDGVTANPTCSSYSRYGGAIGLIEDGDNKSGAYVKFTSFTTSMSGNAANLTAGGLVAKATKSFIDVTGTNAAPTRVTVSGTIKGGGVVGDLGGGVLRLAGTTDLSGAQSVAADSDSVGQIVGIRTNGLVFAETGWVLKRSTTAVKADDIGSWGEVVRFGGKSTEVADSKNITWEQFGSVNVIKVNEDDHYVVVQASTVSDSTITVSSLGEFAKAALNMQLNDASTTGVLTFALTRNDYKASELLKKNITVTSASDLSLAGTGLTGLTRDNGDTNTTYSGTFNGGGKTITLAIGEPYGKDIDSSNTTDGNGRIYRHQYNGLFGVVSGGAVNNVTLNGSIALDALKDEIYAGVAVGKATGGFNSSTVTAGAVVKVSGAKKIYVGGLIGGTDSGIKSMNISGATISCNITSTNTGASSIGGVIGIINHTNAAIEKVNANDENETPKWVLSGSSVSGTISAGENNVGGLIANISECTGTSQRTLELTDIDISSLTITGTGTTMGGLLGYAWLNVNPVFHRVNINTGCSLNNTTNVEAAGLVYRGTGHWTAEKTRKSGETTDSPGIKINGITVSMANAKSFGMFVNRGTSASAIYLEIKDGYDGFKISSADLTGLKSNCVYDDLVAFSANISNGISDVLENGQGVVSFNNGVSAGGGLTMDKTSASNTYQGQTSRKNEANPNTRYYYNLDTIRGRATKSASDNLMLWGVRQYAHSSIQSYFPLASGFGAVIPNDTYDLTGYSWYPVDVSGTVTVNGTITLANEEFEGSEGKNNPVTVEGNTTYNHTRSSLCASDATITQHYLMHNSLFRNVSGSLKAGTLELCGTIGKVENSSLNEYGSGALVCGTVNGTDSSIANVSTNTSGYIKLNGIRVHTVDLTANGQYAPLLINKADEYIALSITDVQVKNTAAAGASPTSYYKTNSNAYAATSLIGDVGKDENSQSVNVSFQNIKLDARSTADSPALTNVYPTSRSIFTKATLLNKLQYKTGDGIYTFKHSDDWSGSDHVGNVTYGAEINNHDDRDQYYDKEHWYYEETDPKRCVSVDNNNLTTLPTDNNFQTMGFIPYVSVKYSTADNKYQLRVNHATVSLSGCGTYNDPYTIGSGEDLVNIAKALNGDKSVKVTLPKMSSGTNENEQNLLAKSWETDGHAEYDGSSGTYKKSGSSSGYAQTAVQKYLAAAYYKLGDSIVLDESFTGLGFSATDTAGLSAFRGVIDGNNKTITNKSGKPLIVSSNGSVVKNLTITVGSDISLSLGKNSYTYRYDTDYASASPSYGAVIGQIMGGDNIIDNVKVNYSTYKITVGGSYAHLIPVGGYVGVVVNGGLYFRNMDKLTAVARAGLANANVTNGTDTDMIKKEDDTPNRKWLYVNPIIGRVINGFAVTESNAYRPFENGQRDYTGADTKTTVTWTDTSTSNQASVTMQNSNKHYSIADINKTSTDKFTFGGSNNNDITIGDSQALYIMSLMINSGMSKSGLGYATNSYKRFRPTAQYDDIGSGAAATGGDYDKAKTDGYYAQPTLIRYLGSSNSDYKDKFANNTSANITLSSDTDIYYLPDGFKGIGNMFCGKDDNNYRIRPNTFDGNGKKISQNTYYYYYDNDGSSYSPSGGFAGGLGFINFLNQAGTYKNLYLTGSVKTDLVDKDTGNFVTTKAAKDIDILNNSCNKYLCGGMLIGTASADVTIENAALTNIDVIAIRDSGGMIGFVTGGKTAKFEILTSADKNAYNSADIRVHGRASTGGFIGKVNEGYVKIDLYYHTFNLTEVVCECTDRGTDSNYYDYGVGGFVGMIRKGVKGVSTTVQNYFRKITIGSKDKKQKVECNKITTGDGIYTAGVVGIMNKADRVEISDCTFYNLDVIADYGAAGLVAFPTTYTPATATNVHLYSPLGSTIESKNNFAGGLIGSSDDRSGAANGSQGFTFDNCSVDNYTIKGASGAGGVIGFRGAYDATVTINLTNSSVTNCTVQSNTSVGAIAGQLNKSLYGYNVYTSNITLSPISGTTVTNRGYMCGLNNSVIKIAGFSRAGTGTIAVDAMTGNSESPYNYGSGGYVVFADHDGTCTDDDKKGTAVSDFASGTTVAASVPYVTTSPKTALTTAEGSTFLSGDATVGSSFATTMFSKILDEVSNNTVGAYKSIKIWNTYSGKSSAKSVSSGMSNPSLSDFKTKYENQIAISSREFEKDNITAFPMLVVDDSDYKAVTATINDYINVLANTQGYDYAQNDSIHEVSIRKLRYNSTSQMFEVAATAGTEETPCLGLDEVGGSYYFWMDPSNVDNADPNTPQFTLLDVQFLDPSSTSSSKSVAYHLYVPIYVKKLLQFNFAISFASNTNYDKSIYQNIRSNQLFENMGAPVTMEFEYTYDRTLDGWKDAINEGDNVQTNYYKSLTIKDHIGGGWASDTRLVLVDASNNDKYYYMNTPPTFDENHKTTIDLYDFTSTGDSSGVHFQPVKLNDLMEVTIVRDDSNGTLIRCEASNATVIGKDGYYYKNKTKEDSTSTLYKVTSVSPKTASSSNQIDAERYYISIFTKKTDSNTIYHYEVNTKESFASSDGNKWTMVGWLPNKITTMPDSAHLFIGNLYENKIKSINVDSHDNDNPLMSKSNDFLTVTMTAQIELTSNAKTAGVAAVISGASDAHIYQTFMMNYEKKASDDAAVIGIQYNAKPSAIKIDKYRLYQCASNSVVDEEDPNDPDNTPYTDLKNTATYDISNNYIEIRNNRDIKSSVSTGDPITIKTQFDVIYDAEDLSGQFPEKDTTDESQSGYGAKVIGYSSITSVQEGAAYGSSLDRMVDTEDKLYYTSGSVSAELKYDLDSTSVDSTDPVGPYSPLGINALEVGKTPQQIKTYAQYDTSMLKTREDYIEFKLQLFEKEAGASSKYTSDLKISDYLTDLEITGNNGTLLFRQTGDIINTANIKMTRNDNEYIVRVHKSQLISPVDGKYCVNIVFKVKTGDDDFGNDPLNKYSNYKVLLTADMYSSMSAASKLQPASAFDHVIYTNAKVYSDVI